MDTWYCASITFPLHQLFRPREWYNLMSVGLHFYACCLWPWLSPPLTALRYVMYFWFCGWRQPCFHTITIWHIICIQKAVIEHNKHDIRESNQILLNDKDQEVLVASSTAGVKSAVYGCPVTGLQQAAGDDGRRVGAGQQRSEQESRWTGISNNQAGTTAAAEGANLCRHWAGQCNIQAHEWVEY